MIIRTATYPYGPANRMDGDTIVQRLQVVAGRPRFVVTTLAPYVTEMNTGFRVST